MMPRFPYLHVVCGLFACVLLFGCVRQEGLYPGVTGVPLPAATNTPSPVFVNESFVAPHAETPPAPQQPDPPKDVERETTTDAPAKTAQPQSGINWRGQRSYFINREVKSDNIGMFPRWVGMLARYNAEAHTLDAICGPDIYSPCKLKEWKDKLEAVRGADIQKQMEAVNRFANQYPYIDDIVNWGFDNYWETPYEFQRQSGNCKDYAIAKFMSLRALGVPNDMMRVMVVQDLNLGGIIHAVLIVFVDDKAYILDNQIKQVTPALNIYHYVPIYSINEQHWWQHFPQK